MKKHYSTVNLAGDWYIAYLGGDKFVSEIEPSGEYYLIKNAIPAYLEDMGDKFRATPLHAKLKYNPLYTLQRYPQAGYVPDMALPNYVGSFAYSRTFTLTELRNTEYELYVGGVQNSLYAFINGHFISSHEGYSSPFSMKIPNEHLAVGENRVTLVVSNLRLEGYMGRPVFGCTSRAANECTGGIYGDVELRSYHKSLHDFTFNVSEDLKTLLVRLDRETDVPLTAYIKDGEKILRSAPIFQGKTDFFIDLSDLEKWTLTNPKRYTLSVTDGEYEISALFGIRRLTARGMRLFFNGEPFFARGICEHGYYPETVHPPRDKDYFRRSVRVLKKLGFNLIRFHTTVPVKEYLEACDELGILVEVETPNNTTYNEWVDVVNYCRKYTSAVIYSSGNEMVIDEDYIEHLSRCAHLVHETDALFSPMSAMRGIEYHSYGDCRVEEPFPHNPKRLAALDEFSDLYNSYSLGNLSYHSANADHRLLDNRNSIYKKPLLSHEISINGTYADLSLKDRYIGTRIGDTELFTSVERHLKDRGLLKRSPIYYKNSSEWQRRIRKLCFEEARLSETLAGYDFLGDIDHHWHTFGYCVGMMNEFYELKPGETLSNVRRYNSDTVILADLPTCRSFESEDELTVPIILSNYGKEISLATVCLTLGDGDGIYLIKTLSIEHIRRGLNTHICDLNIKMPKVESPKSLKLHAVVIGAGTDIDNEWELYVFPQTLKGSSTDIPSGITVCNDISEDELVSKMKAGECVVLFGSGPFSSEKTSFQIGMAGRTTGHLATVINESILMEDFPHDGFCSFQFRNMLDGGNAVMLDLPSIPFEPIIEIATSYKNARREALLFEYAIDKGTLIVCSLNLRDDDPGARYLKGKILDYAICEHAPKHSLSIEELRQLCKDPIRIESKNENRALNINDITAK